MGKEWTNHTKVNVGYAFIANSFPYYPMKMIENYYHCSLLIRKVKKKCYLLSIYCMLAESTGFVGQVPYVLGVKAK